jgi:hypothetical protein
MELKNQSNIIKAELLLIKNDEKSLKLNWKNKNFLAK